MSGILDIHGNGERSACPHVLPAARLRSIGALISVLNLEVLCYICSIAVSQSHEWRGITNHMSWTPGNSPLTSLLVNVIVVRKGLDCRPERLLQEVVSLFDGELRGW
jgi:hypothetical protein